MQQPPSLFYSSIPTDLLKETD